MDEEVVDRRSKLVTAMIAAQLILLLVVAAYFAYVTNQQNHQLAAGTLRQVQAFANQTVQNREVIREVRQDVTIHGAATAARNCSLAKMLQYLVRQAPDVEAPILRRVHSFTRDACKFVDPHTGARQNPKAAAGASPQPRHDGPSAPHGQAAPKSSPSPQPEPSSSPSPEPEPSTSPTESSLVCVVDICIDGDRIVESPSPEPTPPPEDEGDSGGVAGP